ncbi:hypothetical protein QEN19_001222 [Hanseniaspora menglaensis]
MDYEHSDSNETNYLLEYSTNNIQFNDHDQHSTISLLNRSVEDIMNEENKNAAVSLSKELSSQKTSSSLKDIESLFQQQDSEVIVMQAKLYSLFKNRDKANNFKVMLISLSVSEQEILKFIKVLESYVYFIRLYEYQLYCLNNDKYIKFLIDTMVNNDLNENGELANFNLFKNIIVTFNSHPTNIYMRLSWILYNKSVKSKGEIFQHWKNISLIKLNLGKVTRIWNERTQRKLLNTLILKYNKNTDEFHKVTNAFLYKLLTTKALLKWKNKQSLIGKYDHFGEDLVREQVFKTYFLTNMAKLKKINAIANEFKNKNLSVMFLVKLKNKINKIKDLDDWAKHKFETKFKSETFLKMNDNIDSLKKLKKISTVFTLQKHFKNIIFQAENRALSDSFYFHNLKKTCFKRILFSYKLKTKVVRHNQLLKKLALDMWVNRFLKNINMSESAILKCESRDINPIKISAIYQLQKKSDYILVLQSILDENKVMLNEALFRKYIQSWRAILHNITMNKLEYLMQLFYKNNYQYQIKKKAVSRLKQFLQADHYDMIDADFYYQANLKKRVMRSMYNCFSNIKNQELIASKYKEKKAALNILFNFRSKFRLTKDLAQLASVYKDRKLFKSVKKAINHWNLKLLKIKNMSNSLDTHIKRWKRAETRGIISLWLNQKNALTEYKYQGEISNNSELISVNSKEIFSDETLNRKLNTFDSRDEALIYETPLKKVRNRRDVIDYTNFKNLEIQERKRFYQGSIKKNKNNLSEPILKPSPIKTSKTLSKTMKKKLDFEDSLHVSDLNTPGGTYSVAKASNRDEILNKYQLSEYKFDIDQTPFVKTNYSTSRLQFSGDRTNEFDKKNHVAKIVSSSPIKKHNNGLGKIPHLSKSPDLDLKF